MRTYVALRRTLAGRVLWCDGAVFVCRVVVRSRGARGGGRTRA